MYRVHTQNAQYIEPRLLSRRASSGPTLPASAESRLCLDNPSRQQQRHAVLRDPWLSEEHSIRRGAANGLSPKPFLPTSGTGGVAVRTQIRATLGG